MKNVNNSSRDHWLWSFLGVYKYCMKLSFTGWKYEEFLGFAMKLFCVIDKSCT